MQKQEVKRTKCTTVCGTSKQVPDSFSVTLMDLFPSWSYVGALELWWRFHNLWKLQHGWFHYWSKGCTACKSTCVQVWFVLQIEFVLFNTWPWKGLLIQNVTYWTGTCSSASKLYISVDLFHGCILLQAIMNLPPFPSFIFHVLHALLAMQRNTVVAVLQLPCWTPFVRELLQLLKNLDRLTCMYAISLPPFPYQSQEHQI